MGRISSIVSAGYAGAAIATMTSRGRRLERVPTRPPRARYRPIPCTEGPRTRGRGADDETAQQELLDRAQDKRDHRRVRNRRIHHHEDTP